MAKFPDTMTIIVKDTEHDGLAFWKWPRRNYCTNLFFEHGIDHIYLDFGAIKNRDVWVPKHWDRILKWLGENGYGRYELRGHGQNAKTGLMLMINKKQRHMFEAHEDAIRLGGLFGAPLWYGVQKRKDVIVLLVPDNWPGCGDGYGGAKWLKSPFQFRASAFIGTKFEEGFGIKGQIGNTVYIPDGIDMVLPISTVKGPTLALLKKMVKEESKYGDMAEYPAFKLNNLRIGYMAQANKGNMRMGYMVAQHWPDYIYDAMHDDVAAAAERVRKFKEDPLSYLEKERVRDENGELVDSYLLEDDDGEETQGIEAILPQYAKYVFRTGDKSLLYTKTIARIIQNQIAQMSQDAILTGGKKLLSAVAMPIPAQMYGKAKLGVIYLHPKMMGPFRATGVAGVIRHPYPSENAGVSVRVEADPSVPLLNDAGQEVRNVCFIQETLRVTGVDFDMDSRGLLSVPHKDSWEMMVLDRWAMLPPIATGGERVASSVPPKDYMEAWCNAAAGDIGLITNLKSRLAAARHWVDKSWWPLIQETDDKLSVELQAAVDQAKHNQKPDKQVIKDAQELLVKLNSIPEDSSYIRLLGNKPERWWAFNKAGKFNAPDPEALSLRTPLGRHVRKHLPLIPSKGMEVWANSFFVNKIKERPGPGYNAGVALWKEMGTHLEVIAKAGFYWEEAKERRADVGKWWTSVWAELAEGDQTFLEQATSAIWRLAFMTDESNQNRLWGAHLPTIFRLLEQDLPRPTTGDLPPPEPIDVKGRLIGIGLNKIKSDAILEVRGLRNGVNARGEVHQYVLTDDNPEMGWMVVDATLPDGFKGRLRVKPQWNASSSFQTW